MSYALHSAVSSENMSLALSGLMSYLEEEEEEEAPRDSNTIAVIHLLREIERKVSSAEGKPWTEPQENWTTTFECERAVASGGNVVQQQDASYLEKLLEEERRRIFETSPSWLSVHLRGIPASDAATLVTRILKSGTGETLTSLEKFMSAFKYEAKITQSVLKVQACWRGSRQRKRYARWAMRLGRIAVLRRRFQPWARTSRGMRHYRLRITRRCFSVWQYAHKVSTHQSVREALWDKNNIVSDLLRGAVLDGADDALEINVDEQAKRTRAREILFEYRGTTL